MDQDVQPTSRGLRQRAEQTLRASAGDIQRMPIEDVQTLVHELQVHQIELEMQNEQLRQTQFDLQTSRDRYSTLYEFAPVGYVTIDTQDRIVEANLTAIAMLGVYRIELVGSRFSNIVARGSRDTWHQHKQAVFSGKTKQICELELTNTEPNSLLVRLESIASTDPQESGPLCRTALIDITELKHARQQIEDRERRYRRLTNAVTDYLYQVRVEHGRAVETIHGANCQYVTGYTPEEFTANPSLWITMVPAEDRLAVQQQATRILSLQQAEPIEHRIRRNDGTHRWVLHTTSAQCDDQGGLLAYDGLLRDITERREAQQALQRLTAELEQQVRDRTSELEASNRQLNLQIAEREHTEQRLREQSAKVAHVARVSTMGEMMAGIAHEINQPLFTISNLAAVCERMLDQPAGANTEELLPMMHTIARQTTRAGDIIKRLRAFTRNSKGPRAPVDINELIEETVELLCAEARRYKTSVTTVLAIKPVVNADRIQVQQVIVNMLRNAFEAMGNTPSDQRRVAIQTSLENGSVNVCVEDTGDGLQYQDPRQAFDAFVTTKTDGLGMGLALSRTLIENHGGRIWFERDVEHGTRCRFTLPVQNEEHTEDA